MRALTLASLTLVSVSCSAEKKPTTSQATPEKIKALADEYYSSKAKNILELNFDTSSIHPDDQCLPHERPLSCVDAVCKRLSKYDCDDISEIRAVTQVCSNQQNGLCIVSVL